MCQSAIKPPPPPSVSEETIPEAEMGKQMQNANKLPHSEPPLSNCQKKEKGLRMKGKGPHLWKSSLPSEKAT